jgi:hypothetical protein
MIRVRQFDRSVGECSPQGNPEEVRVHDFLIKVSRGTESRRL